MRRTLAAILAAVILAAGGVVAGVGVTTTAAAAAPRHGCDFVVIKDTAGPGLRNYRAYDAYCTGSGTPGKWFGPWRFTRSGAAADGLEHLAKLL